MGQVWKLAKGRTFMSGRLAARTEISVLRHHRT